MQIFKIAQENNLTPRERMLLLNKKPATFKSSHPTHSFAGPKRFLTAVNWIKITPDISMSSPALILAAWRKKKDATTGYVSWDDLAAETGSSVENIASTVKYIMQSCPDSVALTVNRAGDCTYCKIKTPVSFEKA